MLLILISNLYLETEWETEWGNRESPIDWTFEKYVWAYSADLILILILFVFLILISIYQ